MFYFNWLAYRICLFFPSFFLCSLSFYVRRILLLSFFFSYLCTVCYFEWILLNEKIISSLTSHSAKENVFSLKKGTHISIRFLFFMYCVRCVKGHPIQSGIQYAVVDQKCAQLNSALRSERMCRRELLQLLCKICHNFIFLMIIAYLYLLL